MRGVEKERGRPSRNGWGKNERRQRTDRGKDKRKRKRWCIKATPIASHPCTEMLQMGQCVQEEVGKHLSVRQWIFFLFFTWSAGLVTRKIEKHISTLKKKKGQKFFRGTLLVCVGLCTWHLRQWRHCDLALWIRGGVRGVSIVIGGVGVSINNKRCS